MKEDRGQEKRYASIDREEEQTGLSSFDRDQPQSKTQTYFVPLSMARVRPPVFLVKWKLMSRLSRCVKTFFATRRMAPCATLAKTALRSSLNRVEKMRAKPSVHSGRASGYAFTVSWGLCERLTRKMDVHPTMAVPATVYTVCSVESSAMGMLSESTIDLK